ncbi:hypothetical protein [Aliivibrio fischeri]|uniref:Uncharacterized protein n=1 Tax=Aliivibrio fischeri TaxID=668 RepID=A0A510UN69_ALIFS|nr:hypothetical protein [Aliivibrio fischeri]GEK15906.1 hypothetical protein AFI02nite_39420 [Aliivibrio fischeri]
MTAELSSLTAKMDALREKGFSDEEINALLSPVLAAPSHSLPLSEEDRAYAEQWNENIETIIDKDKKTWIPFALLLIIGWIPKVFSDNPHSDFSTYWLVGCYVLLFGGAFVFNYKQVGRAKFFLKKRVN